VHAINEPVEQQSNRLAALIEQHSRSVIVLAGGEGSRMRPLVQQWLGENRPKQYCTYVGTRSMLQHTLDRAKAIAPAEQILTIIGKGHRAFLDDAVPAGIPGLVIEPPLNRGTATSIFLAATHLMEENPSTTVLILPSDLFVHPEERFLEHAERACHLSERYEDRLILLGAPPDSPETDYGWIELPNNGEFSFCRGRGTGPIPVKCFHEKPNRRKAESLLSHGSLWNTMVLACEVKTLWSLGWALLPAMMQHFELLRQVMRGVRLNWARPDHITTALAHIYDRMETVDFCYEFLPRAVDRIGVLPMEGIHWSDWGRPERVQKTLHHIGAASAFPSA